MPAPKNLTARGAQAPAQPQPPDDADDLANDEEGAAPAPPATARRRDPMDEIFAAAKRKLGLPEDARPEDLLRAIVGADLAPAGPPRAACKVPLVVDGRRVVLQPGDLIPEGVDLATLSPHAVTRAPKAG